MCRGGVYSIRTPPRPSSFGEERGLSEHPPVIWPLVLRMRFVKGIIRKKVLTRPPIPCASLRMSAAATSRRPSPHPAAPRACSTPSASSSTTASNSPPASASAPSPPPSPMPFGTADIALILARITQGLHRALVLEEQIVRTAARLDAEPQSKPASSARAPHAIAATPPRARPTADRRAGSHLANLPTPEQIAAKVASPADRRGDRRYLPRPRHPAEPSAVAGTAPPHHQIRRQLRQAGHRRRPPAVSTRCPTRPRAIAR